MALRLAAVTVVLPGTPAVLVLSSTPRAPLVVGCVCGHSRVLRGTARVFNDVRVLQGHSRVLTPYTQLAAHQQRSLGLERPHACDAAGTARQALHGSVGADLSTSCGVSHRWVLCSAHGVLTGYRVHLGRSPPAGVVANLPSAVRAAWMSTRWALQRNLAHTGAWLVWCGTIGYSRGTHRVLKEYCITRTLRRRVRVRCRRQQRVPDGLCADRDRGGVPHRRRRRGQACGVWGIPFRRQQPRLPARLLLHHQCVYEHPRGRRRRSFIPAAVRRRHRTHRCAASAPMRAPMH
jgi:hypothetical protein